MIRLIEDNPDLGYVVEKGQINLWPTNPKKFKDPAILIHRGHMLIETSRMPYNNYDNLAQVGVFGSPDFGVPTYLQPYDTRLVSLQVDQTVKKSEPVCLHIDAQMLTKHRSLYPDPESLMMNFEIGNSFFILGGIPSRAIIAVAENPYAPVVDVSR